MRRIADCLFADLEDPVRAARLAAWMCLTIAVAAALALPLLVALPLFLPVAVLPVAATCALLLVTAVVLPRLPWAVWPRWTGVLPAAWTMVLLGAGFGAAGNSLRHYLAFYVLVFLYVGLTQPPGRSVLLLPVAVGSVALASLGNEPVALWVDLMITLAAGVLLGEVVSWASGWKGRARASVEDLLAATVEIGGTGTVPAAARVLARRCCELFGADAAVVLLAEGVPPTRLRAVGWHAPSGTSGVGSLGAAVRGVSEFDLTAGTSGAAGVLRSGRPLFVADARASSVLSQQHVLEMGVASVLQLPVPGEDGCIGVVAVWWWARHDELDEFARRTAQVLSGHAGQVLSRLQATERLETDARTDALTGLANRRELFARLRALPVGGAVVLLDLDFFKQVNDSEGHPAGDRILAAFGRALRSAVRFGGDCAARFGGEEFALLLPDTGAAGAAAAVERLRRQWERAGQRVTFSAGVAERHRTDTPGQCVRRADAALYEAKSAGRNRTWIDGMEPAPDRAPPALPDSPPRPRSR